MDGEISIDSEPGRGSTFVAVIRLERIADRPAAGAAALEPAGRAAPGAPTDLRVLAAEDNPVNRLVLKTLLDQVGVEVVLVENGQAAVEAWEAHVWDLVLMDIRMPVMDGIEAAAAIRRQEAETGRRRTPIIALTAEAMNHQVGGLLAQGFDGHVAKPLQVGQLLAEMDAALMDDTPIEPAARAELL
jgi:CheY-like chemotaxis protein